MLAEEMNPDALLEQARMSDLWNLKESDVAALMRHNQPELLQTASFSSAILRARELQRWSTSEDYLNLLKGASTIENFL